MLSLRLLTRPRTTSLAYAVRFSSTSTSTSAKPKVLLLDPISLAHDELETLKKDATLLVSISVDLFLMAGPQEQGPRGVPRRSAGRVQGHYGDLPPLQGHWIHQRE